MLRRVETQITETGQKIKAEIRQILTEIILSHAKDDRAPLLNVAARGAIHQLLSIILKLRILVLLPVSTMPYVVMVKNYS
jgi:hypothetical protein